MPDSTVRSVRSLGFQLLVLCVLAVMVAACGDDDDTTRAEQVTSTAIDACSQVGATGNLGACESSVDAARAECATLGGPAAEGCAAQLEELLIAATEAYHLGRGACSALSSDAAREACGVASALETPASLPTAPPAVAATPPRSSNAAPATDPTLLPVLPSLAGALLACRVSDDACEEALDAARDSCDRLQSNGAREQCRETLDDLEADAQGGGQGSGNGNNSNGNGNGNRNGRGNGDGGDED